MGTVVYTPRDCGVDYLTFTFLTHIVFLMGERSGAMKTLICGFFLIFVLGSSDAAIAHLGPCPTQDKGLEKIRQSFECSPEEPHYAFCYGEKETCNCNGELIATSGSSQYDPWRGLLFANGEGGWDCRHKCRRYVSGSQVLKPTINVCEECEYECNQNGNGGCRTIKGLALGSCFPDSFGGGCSGIPEGCANCNEVIDCPEEETNPRRL